MGNRADEESYGQNGRGSNGQSFSQPLRSPSRLGSAHGQESELAKLRAQLADRDRRLEEQANNLAEMESSVKELSALIPTDGSSPGGGRASDYDDKNSAQLRQALREKNEKISILTADFDAHRADFRSTLDSLEMASSETERVYEEQKRDLLAQISELQEMRQNQEDFEGVAEQLKQLEELVAELEEGLEESRRGEAEARGEVEFLRGEVERGRSELRREREKAAAALQDAGGNAPSSKELEAKDDEIRGLKTIIHNLSDGQSTPNTNGSSGADKEDVQRLQAALEESRLEREELEREVEQLRRDNASSKMAGQNHARHASESTEKALPMRPRRDTVKAPAPLDEHTVHEQDEEDHQDDGPASNHDYESEALFCELCKSPEHDTLDCTSLRGPASDSLAREESTHHHQPEPADMPKPLSLGSREKEDTPPKDLAAEMAKEKAAAEKDEDKWCALCEQDGHLAFDCPQEQY
jgi:DNA repair exonuclease SbcCD ATPase subunit